MTPANSRTGSFANDRYAAALGFAHLAPAILDVMSHIQDVRMQVSTAALCHDARTRNEWGYTALGS